MNVSRWFHRSLLITVGLGVSLAVTLSAAAQETAVTSSSAGFNVHAPTVEAEDALTFARFAHTSTDSGPVDIYAESLGDTPLIENLAYGEQTDLIMLPAGTYEFVSRPAGSGADGEVLSRLNWLLERRAAWLISNIGLEETNSLQLQPISLIRENIEDVARLRVVNMLSGAPDVTITTDNPLAEVGGLGWLGVADLEVPAGSYTFSGQTSDGAMIPATSLALENNNLYTLVIMGGEDAAPCMLVVTTPEAMSRVRFTNELDETVAVYARPDDTQLIGELAPGETTEFFDFASGNYTFTAYEPGTGIIGHQFASHIGFAVPERDMTVTFRPNGETAVTDMSFTP
jgi:hypothetical protein